ncbi:MAG: hypothetical protein Q9188_002340 [Gyalolechia gomerana]
MLRLASTSINLTLSDINWHVQRHEQRLETLKKGKLSSNVAEGPGTHSQSPEPSRQHNANESSSLSRPGHGAADEIPIYSDEPVPQDSQAFWDNILADAGTSTRAHQTSLARSPQVIVPSDSWLENNGSVRLSIRDTNEEDQSHATSGGDPPELLISPRSPDSDRESAASTEIRPRLSPLSLPSLDGDENWQQSQSHRSSIESLDLQPSKRRNARLDVEAKDHLASQPRERGTDSQDAWANQMDVDGPSDAAPSLRHISSISSLQDPEPGSIGMPFGAQARKAELVASRNAWAARSIATSPASHAGSGTPDQYVQDGYAQVHGVARSGGLPRSRLYISEAAASSSQERCQISIPTWDYEAAIDQDDIHYSPPRRRRKPYRRRSETHSFVASEGSTRRTRIPRAALASVNPFGSSPHDYSHTPPEESRSALMTQEDYAIGSSPALTPRTARDFFSSPRRIRHQHPSSSPYYSPNLSRSRNSSSMYFNGMSSQSHDGSFGLPYIADTNTRENPMLPRQTLGSLPIPTSPASRMPSFNSSLPYRDENNHVPSSSYPPRTPPPPSSSTMSTPTRIPIYNDNLPAYSQPQTPLGLPRHGLPRTSRNPYFTAPARPGGRFRRRAADWVETAFATPSRSSGRRALGMWGAYDGQENVSVEVEAARSERRREEEERRELEERRNAWREGRGDWDSDWEDE